MRSSRRILAVLAFGLLAASAAPAQTITFDGLPLGAVAGDVLVINAGGVDVTFSGSGLIVHQMSQTTFPGTGNQLRANGFLGPIDVEIEAGFVFDFVQIENHINGELTSEVDIITGTAFDAGGAVVDTFTNSLELPQLNGPGIVKATFVAPQTAFLLDNFSFTASVPEPATGLLLAPGLAALALPRRRRARGPEKA